MVECQRLARFPSLVVAIRASLSCHLTVTWSHTQAAGMGSPPRERGVQGGRRQGGGKERQEDLGGVVTGGCS